MRSCAIVGYSLWRLHCGWVLAAACIRHAHGVIGTSLMIIASNARWANLRASCARRATSKPWKRSKLHTSRVNGLMNILSTHTRSSRCEIAHPAISFLVSRVFLGEWNRFIQWLASFNTWETKSMGASHLNRLVTWVACWSRWHST